MFPTDYFKTHIGSNGWLSNVTYLCTTTEINVEVLAHGGWYTSAQADIN